MLTRDAIWRGRLHPRRGLRPLCEARRQFALHHRAFGAGL